MGKMYIGVDGGSGGVARNVKDIYIGVNGVARKVVKGYIGVNGVARQFWGTGGGGTLVFEYDYQNSTQYSVHNYLTLDYVLDTIYQKLITTYSSSISRYANLRNLVNNWQSIKSEVVTAIENSGYNVRCIDAYIQFAKSNGAWDSYATFRVNYGNNTFPRNVRTDTNCKKTDVFGNTYYALATSNPTPPQYKRYIYATVYADSYTVSEITSATGNMTNIGLYCPDGVNTGSARLANFGMEVV